MTLDESDDQTTTSTTSNTDNQENNNNSANQNNDDDAGKQSDNKSMQSNNMEIGDINEDINNNNNNNSGNKAAVKRTFDQISESTSSSSTSTTTSQCTTPSNDSNNDILNIKTELSNNEQPVDENDVKDEKDVNTSVGIIKEPVTFKIVYAKEIYELTRDRYDTILALKNHLQKLTSVSTSSQKLCYKGNLSDAKTLDECGIKDGVKVMMIGSKATDILAVSSVTKDSVVKENKEPVATKEPLCQQKPHKNIIDKGLPENAMSAWIGEDCSLPMEPLTGMLNKFGNKVRMTFKLEQDEVWISTKERTQKIQMTQIKSVISEPITDYQQYHIMALQIGTTEGSKIWLYWVPAQYVRAIKAVILSS